MLKYLLLRDWSWCLLCLIQPLIFRPFAYQPLRDLHILVAFLKQLINAHGPDLRFLLGSLLLLLLLLPELHRRHDLVLDSLGILYSLLQVKLRKHTFRLRLLVLLQLLVLDN